MVISLAKKRLSKSLSEESSTLSRTLSRLAVVRGGFKKSNAFAQKMFQSMQDVYDRRQLLEKLKAFEPKYRVAAESEDFVIKTAESYEELLDILRLRHEVFVTEWQGKNKIFRVDVDRFDWLCDHLMILDKSTGDIVGTYRLIGSQFSDMFYSGSEFQFDQFLAVPGIKLELGRACVHAEFRTGQVMDLLWQGLSSYIVVSNTRYLFGCSSVKTIDVKVINALYSDFKSRERWSDEYDIRPLPEYDFAGFEISDSYEKDLVSKENIPPLLRSYLHAGAKIYGKPALDREFACFDLFTILDLQQLNKKFHQRYFGSN